ncbi:oligosaccharide flippase family protein [Chloroflexota bacterium]
MTSVWLFVLVRQAYLKYNCQMFNNALTTATLQHIKSPLYKNSFFLIANTMVTSGLGFFFWMVVARFYTEAEVGWGAAIISAMIFLALLSRLGFGAVLIRFLPKAEKPIDIINSCFTLTGIVALTLAAIFVSGLDLWSPAISFVKDNLIFATAFAFFVLLWAFSGLTDYIFIAGRRAEFVLVKNTIFSLLKIPLPIVLVLFFHTFGIAAAWGIAAWVSVVVSIFLFLPKVQKHYHPVPKLNVSAIGDMWRYSAGSYLASLFTATPHLILPIMVVNLIGAAYNAYFYVAWIIASLLSAIPLAVSQSLFAEGSHFENKLGANVKRSFKFIFSLLIPAVVLLFLLSNWILLLFGEGYTINGLMLLRILGLSSLFIGVNEVYNSILRVEGRVKELAIISGFIATVVTLGSYFIMPITGIEGIGYVWLAAQGLVALYVLFTLRFFHRVRLV